MDQLAVATFVLAFFTMLGVVTVAADGWRSRRHDAAERRFQRRHDLLREALRALLLSRYQALMLTRSRRSIERFLDAMPPALVRPFAPSTMDQWAELAKTLSASGAATRALGPSFGREVRPELNGVIYRLLTSNRYEGQALNRYMELTTLLIDEAAGELDGTAVATASR